VAMSAAAGREKGRRPARPSTLSGMRRSPKEPG